MEIKSNGTSNGTSRDAVTAIARAATVGASIDQTVATVAAPATVGASIDQIVATVAAHRLVLTYEETRAEHVRALRAALKSTYRQAAIRVGLVR